MSSTRYARLAAFALCLLVSAGCRRDGNGDGDPRIAEPAFPYPDYDPPATPVDPGHNEDPFSTVCVPEPGEPTSTISHVDVDDGGPDSGEAPFAIHADATSVVIPQGGSVDVTVTVERSAPEAIDVSVDGLPEGVTATAFHLSEEENTGIVTLTATQSAAYLAADLARVRGRTLFASQSVPLEIRVRGEAGDRDHSFGARGNAGGVLPLLTVNDAEEQPDGKLVVTGWDAGDEAAEGLVVCRIDTDGSLDASFGGAGCARVDLGSHDEGARLRLQADGSILAATRYGDLRVARFTADGALDTAFGEGGVVTVEDMPSGSVELLTLGGKILVARGGIVARLHKTGAVDVSFGTYGRISTEGAAKIVAHGDCGFVAASADRLTAIDWHGDVDLSFGSFGSVATPFVPSAATTVAGSGDIVVTGEGTETARYTSGGTLVAEYPRFGPLKVADVAVAADGRIVIGGVKYASEYFLSMSRRNADGSPDEGFCACGLDFGQTSGVEVLRDGRYAIFGRNGETSAGLVYRVWD